MAIDKYFKKIIQVRGLARIYGIYQFVRYKKPPIRLWQEIVSLLLFAHAKKYRFVYFRYLLIRYYRYDELQAMLDEVFTHDIYKQLLQKSSPLILDIGANIGIVSLYYSQLYPDARIIAYEPNPSVFACLTETVKVNKLMHITCVQQAVARMASSSREMYVSNSSISSTFHKEQRYEMKDLWYKKIYVKTAALRDIIKTYGQIDLIKMDVEGTEYELIDDIILCSKNIGKFVIEFHKIYSYDFIEIMKKLSRSYYLDLKAVNNLAQQDNATLLNNQKSQFSNTLVVLYGTSKHSNVKN